jgi:hypothetical protein
MSSFIINPYRLKGPGNATFGEVGTVYSSGATSVTSGSSTLANVAAGDLVLAFIQRVAQTQATTVTLNATSMSLVKRNNVPADPFGIDVWGVIAPSASASATITANYSATNTFMTITTARWSGVSSATSIASSCNSSGCDTLDTAFGTSRLALSVTTSEKALIVACGTEWNSAHSQTGVNGWTKRFDGSGTPVNTIQFCLDRVSNAGTYGGATSFSTASSTDSYVSMIVAFPLL